MKNIRVKIISMNKRKSKRSRVLIIIIISAILLGLYGLVQAITIDDNQNSNNTYKNVLNNNLWNLIIPLLPTAEPTEPLVVEITKAVETTVYESTTAAPATVASTTIPDPTTAASGISIPAPTTAEINAEQPQQTTNSPVKSSDNKKMIALTFDDGPSKYTEQILEVLAENKCHATFSVMGYKIDSYKETIKKIVEQGSQVMGHTWDHKELTKLSESAIKKELTDTNDAIFKIIGIHPAMYRPPYGSFNDTVKKVSKELGLAIIHWNVDPGDWKVRDADTVYNNIMSHVKDGCIIGCHDTYASTLEAMKRVIPDLILKGYKLVTVEELLGSTMPGQVYFYKK